MQRNVLVIEDKPSQLRFAEIGRQYKLNYITIVEESVEKIISRSLHAYSQPDLIVIDLSCANALQPRLISEIKIHRPQWPIIVLVPYGGDEFAMQAITAGANDYVTKPVYLDRLILTISNTLKFQNMSQTITKLERFNSGQLDFSDIIGKNDLVSRAIDHSRLVAKTNAPVWIIGEQGTGKELFARTIASNSTQSGKPFIVIDCEKIFAKHIQQKESFEPELNIREMLFLRRIQEAHDSTIYIKNFRYLPISMYSVVADMLAKNVAGHGNKCRLIIACSKPNDQALQHIGASLSQSSGNIIKLPPLRERKEDIELLCKHFLITHTSAENKFISEISEDAIKLLENSEWPGNIHQLSRTILRAVLLCSAQQLDAGTIRLIQQLECINYSGNNPPVNLTPTLLDPKGQLKKLKKIEEEAIRFALAYSGGCMTQAARNLGIGRSTLYRKIDELSEVDHMSLQNQTIRPTMLASASERS